MEDGNVQEWSTETKTGKEIDGRNSGIKLFRMLHVQKLRHEGIRIACRLVNEGETVRGSRWLVMAKGCCCAPSERGTRRGMRIEGADERVTLSQIESIQTSSAISSSFCRSLCPSRNIYDCWRIFHQESIASALRCRCAF